MRLLIVPLTFFLLSSCGGEAATPNNSGKLTVSATLSPDPPKVGQNVMEITVKAGDGAPVEGATVTVDAQMPMHGHSSSEKATVKDLGKGSYEAQPVTLQMPGKWEIKVTAKKGDDVGQTVLKLDVK